MVFQFDKVVAASREALFAFHAVPANLGLLLRHWGAFRVLCDDGDVRPGCMTWLEVRVARCIPVVLGFRHTLYDPPGRLGEELIHGPFAQFDHNGG